MHKPTLWPRELTVSRPNENGVYQVSTMIDGRPVVVAAVSQAKTWSWTGTVVLAPRFGAGFRTLRLALVSIKGAWRHYQRYLPKPPPALLAIDFHRNGVCGRSFHVALCRDPDGSRKLVTWFGNPDHDSDDIDEHATSCSVVDVDLAAAGNIAMHSGNAWRGDHYIDHMRRWARWLWSLDHDQHRLANEGRLEDLPPVPSI
jgi:hypothetical protein